MLSRICLCLFISFVSVLASWSGACAQSLPASLAACAAETDDRHRLSCYDREAEKLAGYERPEASPDQDAPVPSTDEFGYRGKLAREELDRQAAKENKHERISASVTNVSSRPRGELVLTLDNGQVWEQKSPDSKIRIGVGDEIAIKRGAFGSFMLVTQTGRSTRVTRLE